MSNAIHFLILWNRLCELDRSLKTSRMYQSTSNFELWSTIILLSCKRLWHYDFSLVLLFILISFHFTTSLLYHLLITIYRIHGKKIIFLFIFTDPSSRGFLDDLFKHFINYIIKRCKTGWKRCCLCSGQSPMAGLPPKIWREYSERSAMTTLSLPSPLTKSNQMYYARSRKTAFIRINW